MKAKEFYIKKYAINHSISFIESTAGDVFEIMEEYAKQQNKELIENHKKTLQLLADVSNGLIDFDRQTVKNRLKIYIEEHLKELKTNKK